MPLGRGVRVTEPKCVDDDEKDEHEGHGVVVEGDVDNADDQVDEVDLRLLVLNLRNPTFHLKAVTCLVLKSNLLCCVLQ
jgi:hypothetical protein